MQSVVTALGEGHKVARNTAELRTWLRDLFSLLIDQADERREYVGSLPCQHDLFITVLRNILKIGMDNRHTIRERQAWQAGSRGNNF